MYNFILLRCNNFAIFSPFFSIIIFMHANKEGETLLSISKNTTDFTMN
jgi:hypothetical protein